MADEHHEYCFGCGVQLEAWPNFRTAIRFSVLRFDTERGADVPRETAFCVACAKYACAMCRRYVGPDDGIYDDDTGYIYCDRDCAARHEEARSEECRI